MIQPVGDPALRIFADINFKMLFIKVIEYIHSLEEFLGTSNTVFGKVKFPQRQVLVYFYQSDVRPPPENIQEFA